MTKKIEAVVETDVVGVLYVGSVLTLSTTAIRLGADFVEAVGPAISMGHKKIVALRWRERKSCTTSVFLRSHQ